MEALGRANGSLRMAASISEPLDFKPTLRVLEAALGEFDDLGSNSGSAVEPQVRRAALEVFRNFGRERTAFPSRWRYDYAALQFEELIWSTGRARVPALPRAGRSAQAQPSDAPALAVDNAGGLVHLGSVYLEPEIRIGDPRVTLLALADAQRAFPERVAGVRRRFARPHADRFAALATAFQNCGAYVDIPDGVVLDAPLQLLWTSRRGSASAVFPQTVVRVGVGARATIVERHVGDGESFVNGIVEIELASQAQLDYVVVQGADDAARLFFRRAARCAAGATVGWHVAELGAGLVRSVVDTQLAEAAATANVNVLFFARGFGHVDLAVEIDHDGSETVSQTIVRSAASDRGQGRFAGGVRIPRTARGCKASMRDDALVLSRDAYLEAVPALEIAANDVSASHAATVGSLDEEQLFYVQSRGFARGTAERMVALAFFEPAIVRFPTEVFRDEIRTALDERLDEIPETFVS